MNINLEKYKNLNLRQQMIIAEGKSKVIYKINEEESIMFYKPHLRSITSQREQNIEGTDLWRLYATIYFMNLLKKNSIKTHIRHNKVLDFGNKKGLLVSQVKPIPIEWICRYFAAGSIVRLYPSLVKEGQKFEKPLYKYDLKQDISVTGQDDPTLNESYITGLGLLTEEQLIKAKGMLRDVGEIINNDLFKKGIQLIDMKMEFGIDKYGEIIVIDEISQDCIRANDIKTNQSVTKDAFRQLKSEEDVINAYRRFILTLDTDIESEITKI